MRYITSNPDKIVVRTGTGNGSNTDFTVSNGLNINQVFVTENGVLQQPTTDYTISGSTLAFAVAPANGVQVIIRELR